MFSLFPIEGFDVMVQLAFGTVLDDDEDAGSEHAIAAAGPAVAVLLHGSYEQGIPMSPEWVAEIEKVDEKVRHLAIHDRHLIAVTERDRPFVNGDLIRGFTFSGTRAEVADKIEAAGAAGVDRDRVPTLRSRHSGELRTFAEAAGLA